MAERRIFSIKVTESDAFFALPANAQALYLHLNMLADDDGFINNSQSAVSRIQGGKTALKCLIEKRFLLQSGMVLVVKHWRIANSLKSDRMKPLSYPEIAKGIWVKSGNQPIQHRGSMLRRWNCIPVKSGWKRMVSRNQPRVLGEGGGVSRVYYLHFEKSNYQAHG